MENYMHMFKKDKNYYIVDGDNLSVYKIPDEFRNQLDGLDDKEVEQFASKLKSKPCANTQEIENSITDICQRLILNMSSNCNLRCKYCYAEGGEYGTGKLCNMKETTLINTVSNMLDIYPKGIKYIQFFGGEPLLNKGLLSKCIPIINQMCEERELDIPKYVIVTNGTLIDDEIMELFNQYFTSVTISIDGDKYVNDVGRVFKDTDGSVFEKVAETINKINMVGRNYYLSLEITVNKYHIEELKKDGFIKSLDVLYSMNVDFFEMSPVFDMCNCGLGLDNLPREEVIEFFDRWVNDSFEKNSDKKIQFSTVASIIKAFHEKRYRGNNCGAVKSDVAIDVNGDIYPCFMFIGADKYLLGNVNTFESDKYIQKRNIVREEFVSANENDKCQSCWAKKLCSSSYGHCIGARFLTMGTVNEPIELACQIGRTVIERTLVQAVERFSIKR